MIYTRMIGDKEEDDKEAEGGVVVSFHFEGGSSWINISFIFIQLFTASCVGSNLIYSIQRLLRRWKTADFISKFNPFCVFSQKGQRN